MTLTNALTVAYSCQCPPLSLRRLGRDRRKAVSVYQELFIRTNFYIDRFNLHNRAVKDTPYKWLDLDKLCHSLVPKHEVTRIRYFTALVEPGGDPQRPQRQQVFLRALDTIPILSIHLGQFMPRKK